MTSITQFKTALVNGGARANQFEVFLHTPPGVQNINANVQFLVEAASLPGSSINPTVTMYRGREVKLAGERRFDNWSVTVINDSAFSIHSVIEKWMNYINDLSENTGQATPGLYTADLRVNQLDRNSVALKGYKIVHAWPVAMSPIQLGYDQNDVIERFSVEFTYDWFEPSTIFSI